jgi:hypothetical protein
MKGVFYQILKEALRLLIYLVIIAVVWWIAADFFFGCMDDLVFDLGGP